MTQLMLYTKYQPNILSGAGEELILRVKLFLAKAAILIPDQPEFYHSEAPQPCHAACEI